MTETPGTPEPQQMSAPEAPAQPQKRPGGLTALAVLNFVFGGLGVFGALGLIGVMMGADAIRRMAEQQGAEVHVPGVGLLAITTIIYVVSVVLLIVSGVGYIKMSKSLGYNMGNAYGVLGIVGAILGVLVGGFGLGTILGLIYPVLTLILLNTTFKKCFA